VTNAIERTDVALARKRRTDAPGFDSPSSHHVVCKHHQTNREKIIMGSIIDDLAAKVAAYTTVEASTVALLTDLSARLKSAVASGDPTQLTGLIAQIDANNAALAAAVVANTPVVAPAPVPAPVAPPVVAAPPVADAPASTTPAGDPTSTPATPAAGTTTTSS
jgi:hypothetical protein